MNLKQLLLCTACIILLSCNEKREADSSTPAPLQKNKESFYDRSEGDLLVSLYEEAKKQDPTLSQLSTNYSTLLKSKTDSVESYSVYNRKNQSYFAAANTHLAYMKDSTLRQQIRSLINAQLAKYSALTATHEALLKRVEANETELVDLHQALMLVKTLPIIDRYQSSQLPERSSIDGYIKEQTAVISEAKKALKK